MASRRGGSGSMGGHSGVVIGLVLTVLICSVLYMLVPFIGGTIETSMPAVAANSDWNSTHNTNLKTGADVWTTGQGLIIVVLIVLILFTILAILMSLGKI